MDWIVRQAEGHQASMERATEWINNRTFELLKEEFNPSDIENVIETLQDTSDERWATIKEYCDNRDFEKFGKALWCLVFDYMEQGAEHRAEMEYSKGP
jgi:hypothetical protein